MRKKSHKKGFTLVELALSLVFISVLSITVVLLIQNTVAAYRRGLTLNEINTVGMDLIDDMRISIQNASSESIARLCDTLFDQNKNETNYEKCIIDQGYSFISVTKYGTVETRMRGESSWTKLGDNFPVYGAFCTGTYTYIWNSGYFENTENEERRVRIGANILDPATVGNVGLAYVANGNFRLLKLYDNERSVCVGVMEAMAERRFGASDIKSENRLYLTYADYENSKISNQFLVEAGSDANSDGTVELLQKSETGDLALYDLYVARPAMSATRRNMLYSAAFILGTKRGGINISATGNSCRPPSDAYSELEYCAINKFNFAVQAGGE